MAKKKLKPVVTRAKFHKRKRRPSAFIRTEMKTAEEDVRAVGFWRRFKTAAPVPPPVPHPFLAELLALPVGFGALGGGVGSLVDEEDAAKRYALTAGLMGLGVALGRGAGAKFLSPAKQNIKGLLSGGGLGAGAVASDVLLPEMGYDPVFDNITQE